MKKVINKALMLIACSIIAMKMNAQESTSAFNTLRLPVSAYQSALGGENISAIFDVPSIGLNNPALNSFVSDNSLGLHFMTYADGANLFGAQYVKALGERHTLFAQAGYQGFGEMNETDESGVILGKFSPKDIQFGVGYSYLLSDRWAGGVNMKFITASISDFKSTAIAFDLGLNYFDEDRDLSVSAVMRNVGAQLTTFDRRTERLPYSLQLGFSKGISHTPFRLSVTAVDLTRWKDRDFVGDQDEKVNFGAKLIRHFVVGLEIIPKDYMYLAVGYNFRRAAELKAAGSSKLAGLTIGGGINIKDIKFGVAYARYHQSYSSLMFNLAYALPISKTSSKLSEE